MEPKDSGKKSPPDFVRQMELPPEFEDSLNAKIRGIFNKLWEEKKQSLLEEMEKMKASLAESALEDLMGEAPPVSQDFYPLGPLKKAVQAQKSNPYPTPSPAPDKAALITSLLFDLQEAKKMKNQDKARFCRARLRELGWNVSIHGYKPPASPIVVGHKFHPPSSPALSTEIQKVSGAELKNIVAKGPPKTISDAIKNISNEINKALDQELDDMKKTLDKGKGVKDNG